MSNNLTGDLVIASQNQTNRLENDKTDGKYDILSKRLSYWIDVLRAIMMIHVICGHYAPRAQSYDSKLKWFEIFFPHLFVSVGGAAVTVFFGLSGFFSAITFEKMYQQSDTFIKKWTMQFVKRYFQIRAVLFTFGLGLGAIYYIALGEKPRNVWLEGPRLLDYWLDYYLPIYWNNRVWRNVKYITNASWYNQALMNVEFIFYCFFLVFYFVRKRYSEKTFFLSFVVAISIFLIVMQVTANSKSFEENFIYLTGVLLMWLRKWTIKSMRGRKVIDYMYASTKQNKIVQWVVFLTCVETWLVLCRTVSWLCFVPIFILIELDCVPNFQLPVFFTTIVNEMKRLQMEIYIIHQSFVEHAQPRFYPAIEPHDLNCLNAFWVSWLTAPLLTIQFMLFSYPIWLFTKPIESIPTWLSELFNKQKRKGFWINTCIGIVIVIIDIVVISLTQSGVFGQAEVRKPRIWE